MGGGGGGRKTIRKIRTKDNGIDRTRVRDEKKRIKREVERRTQTLLRALNIE
jgi:hypothetical protein